MSGTNGNAQDVESQGNPTENSPLLPHSADSSVNSSAATTPTTTTSHSHVEDPDGDFAKELEKPWPATFERSMMILAGPIMDEKSVDAYTKSPSVRNRYLKKNQKQGFFTPDASTLPTTPGTPAWLKKGLVRLKSLDYRFSDDDTAIFPGRMPQPQRFDAGMKQSQKKKDSHAYRMEVLKKTGGLRSAGNLEVEVGGYQYSQMQQQQQKKMTRDDEEDVTKSPGFRREKQIDRQRRKEKRREEEGGGGAGKERGAEGEAKGKDAHGHGVGANDHKSSFMQSTFNMANILMGVGMLGLPYVLKSAGWIGGTITTIGFCLVTWRTSYYLGRELNGDPRPVSLFDNNTPSKSQTPDSKATNGSHPHPNPDTHILQRMRKPITSFPGIAREAFGDNGCICLSAVLYFELFSCLSIFFVSLGDHLHALFPSISQSKHMTIAAGVLIVPSAVLRTPKLLSYLSAVGTVATVAVVSAVVLSALVMFILMMKAEHDIAGSDGGDVEVVGGNERDFTLYSSNGLPLALGIVAYCFSGHAIVPSIYSSMARPQDFERMIDVTYGMVLACCLLVGISGYYMFGNDVEDQITLSLENQSENGNTLMTMLTWLMILTAMSKFTLTMFPLALGFEEMLTGILPSDLAMELIDSLVKIVLIFLSLAVAIFFPSFSFLCSLVGLICTMIVSVIFPAMAHLKLFGSELSMLDKMIDWLLVAGGSIVAVVGTIATVQADA